MGAAAAVGRGMLQGSVDDSRSRAAAAAYRKGASRAAAGAAAGHKEEVGARRGVGRKETGQGNLGAALARMVVHVAIRQVAGRAGPSQAWAGAARRRRPLDPWANFAPSRPPQCDPYLAEPSGDETKRVGAKLCLRQAFLPLTPGERPPLTRPTPDDQRKAMHACIAQALTVEQGVRASLWDGLP